MSIRITSHRRATSLLGAVLMVTAPATATIGADDDPGRSLCDTISVTELQALTGLAYEPGLSESWVCNFLAPAEEGFYVILLATDTSGMDSLEGQRSPGSVDVTVAGASGVATSDDGDVFLVLDTGEHGTLRVNVDAGSAEAAGTDGLALAQAVAEIVIPRLGAVPTASEAPTSTSGATSLAPPEEVATELRLREAISASGAAAFEERSEEELAIFAAMLETLGADRERLSLYVANAGGGGSYLAVRVADAPADAVQSALLDAIGLSGALEGWTSEAAVVGGKDITLMTSEASPDQPVHVYADGDAVFLVQLAPDDAATLLAALP